MNYHNNQDEPETNICSNCGEYYCSCGMEGPDYEPEFCPHCHKEYEDFSELGCGHCDRRHPNWSELE
jgi:hypothetical protein